MNPSNQAWIDSSRVRSGVTSRKTSQNSEREAIHSNPQQSNAIQCNLPLPVAISIFEDETSDILSYARGLLRAVKMPLEKQDAEIS